MLEKRPFKILPHVEFNCEESIQHNQSSKKTMQLVILKETI